MKKLKEIFFYGIVGILFVFFFMDVLFKGLVRLFSKFFFNGDETKGLYSILIIICVVQFLNYLISKFKKRSRMK